VTQSPNQRLDRIEDEFETVKQLLASAARHAESANVKIDRLSDRQDRTQVQLDQLNNTVNDLTTSQSQTESRLAEFIFQAQRLITQQAERLIRVEGQANRLEAIILRLDRNYEAQQAQLQELQRSNQEFQQSTTAALERIDRILDYLLRQQGGSR
jgi:chromosome segregation ATPase